MAGKFPTATGTGVGDYHFANLARRFAAIEPPADNVAEPHQVCVVLIVAVADADAIEVIKEIIRALCLGWDGRSDPAGRASAGQERQ